MDGNKETKHIENKIVMGKGQDFEIIGEKVEDLELVLNNQDLQAFEGMSHMPLFFANFNFSAA